MSLRWGDLDLPAGESKRELELTLGFRDNVPVRDQGLVQGAITLLVEAPVVKVQQPRRGGGMYDKCNFLPLSHVKSRRSMPSLDLLRVYDLVVRLHGVAGPPAIRLFNAHRRIIFSSSFFGLLVQFVSGLWLVITTERSLHLQFLLQCRNFASVIKKWRQWC